MEYNRTQLCKLGGVAYTALQSLQRRGVDVFNVGAVGDGVPIFNERSILELALAGTLSAPAGGIPGLSLGDAFEVVWILQYPVLDYINRVKKTGQREKSFYVGVGSVISATEKSRVYDGASLEEIARDERNLIDTGHMPVRRITLIDLEQVLQLIELRAAEFGIPYTVSDIE